MAISRSQMRRQLSNRGGITNLSPRQNFGLGSKLKRFVRKVIPNEVSKVASAAAPFVAPFNPALAGAMAGIGSFDQTGSLSDAFKRGALTYGGGQAARYIGGAGFQGNPFQGGMQGTLQNFTSFSSPIGTETGLGKFFDKPGAPIKEVQPVGVEASEVALTGNVPDAVAGNIVDEVALTGTTPLEMSEVALTGNVPDAVGGNKIVPTNLNDFQGTKQVVDSAKENAFQKILKDPSVENIGKAAVDAAKKVGKAIFYDKDGNLDKNVLLGTLAFTASYAEAKSLANDVGVDLTESEYDEARKAEKKEEYASNLQNFFGGKKEGGRIGFNEGGFEPFKYTSKIKEMWEMEGEDDPLGTIVKIGLTVRAPIIDIVRILGITGAAGASLVAEVAKLGYDVTKPIRDVASDTAGAIYDVGKDVVKGSKTDTRFIQPMYYATRFGPEKNLTDEETQLEMMKYSVGRDDPKKRRELENIVFGFDDAGMNQTDEDMEISERIKFNEKYNMADGGRIGFDEGTPKGGIDMIALEENVRKYPEMVNEITNIEFGVGIPDEPTDQGPFIRFDKEKEEAEMLEELLRELQADGGRTGFFAGKIVKEGIKQLGKIIFSPAEKTFLFKTLGKLGGADRSSTFPNLFKILKDPSKFPKDAKALKEFINLRMKKAKGGIMDIPVRRNEAGVQELDMRSSGGFIPIGVKEKADDVPAMLSKNEFVLTADAVRGIGGGSVEKGSEKLYNLMKTAEQVGRA